MASAFGIAITNLTSRFGIVSRKAAMRIATETGYKLVDKSREVGRFVNKEEVEQIFGTLPKRLRPKVITNNEYANILRNNGISELEIEKELANQSVGAACVFNGTKKTSIWLPYDRIQTSSPQEMQTTITNSKIAHELEHALETNNRILWIFRRKISKIKEFFGKLFDKNYIEKMNDIENDIHRFERRIYNGIPVKRVDGKQLLKCPPTVEDIDKFGKENYSYGLIDKLREAMRRYAHPEHQGSEQSKRFNEMIKFLNLEKPAYQVAGNVDRYDFNLQAGENPFYTGVAKGYEAAIDVAKQERRIYWKNKLLGKLKKPIKYTDDKDLLKYATSQEEKQIMLDLIKGLNREQKQCLMGIIPLWENQPNVIKNIKQFVDKTTVNGKNIIEPFKIDALHYPDVKLLNDDNYIKIARILNSGIKEGFIDFCVLITKMHYLNTEQIAIYAEKLEKALKEEKNIGRIAKVINKEIDLLIAKNSSR